MKYLILTLFALNGCFVYKLSGTQLPSNIKSIAIPFIEDRSRGGVPQMSENLQQQLVDKFVRQNGLRLLTDENSADAYIQAYISEYSNQPEAVSQIQATQNRVSISVQIKVIDRVKEADLVNRMFTQSVSYNPNAGLNGELEAARQALKQIAEEAFTACSSDW